MEEKKCPICLTMFCKTAGMGAKRWSLKQYCGRVCYWRSRTGKIRPELYRRSARPCVACGAEFICGGRSGIRKDAKYCSRKCRGAARWRTGSHAKRFTIPQAAYLAGLIDGEGSIMLYRRGEGSAMRLTIANTFKPVLEWCRAVSGVGNIVMTNRDNAKHKPGGTWLVNSQAACSILEQVRPYLRIKAEQADLAMAFQRKLKVPAEKALKEWQEQWRQRLCLMNRRGPQFTCTVSAGG